MKARLPNAVHVARATTACNQSGTNTLVKLKYKEWEPIKSRVQNRNIKHAVYFHNKYYAVDEHNKLVIAPKHVLRYFSGDKILQMEKMGKNTIFFVLKDKVVTVNTEHKTYEHFRGEVLELIAGDSHAYFRTSEGYFVSGENTSFEFGMEDLRFVPKPIPATSLNKLPIVQVYCGGWHCYAKLQDSTFLGWGYNRVCFLSE
jgi:hypothetical protein